MSFYGLIEALINPGHFMHPALSLAMVELHKLIVRPVEVIGQIGYLFEQAVRGVAYGSPTASISTSNDSSQRGQTTARRL